MTRAPDPAVLKQSPTLLRAQAIDYGRRGLHALAEHCEKQARHVENERRRNGGTR